MESAKRGPAWNSCTHVFLYVCHEILKWLFLTEVTARNVLDISLIFQDL